MKFFTLLPSNLKSYSVTILSEIVDASIIQITSANRLKFWSDLNNLTVIHHFNHTIIYVNNAEAKALTS